MHEKEIFSGTPASENGPRDLDLRLAFGQHALRFGKTRANERRAAVRAAYIISPGQACDDVPQRDGIVWDSPGPGGLAVAKPSHPDGIV
jgi:hypothetical protein